MFSDVRFLRKVEQQTSARRRIRHLLVLAMRCLAVATVVVAFAQPYFPKAGQEAPNQGAVVSIYVDNSFSMQAAGKTGSLLDEAKAAARSIAGSYRASDLFHLVTNDFLGEHQRLLSRGAFWDAVEKIQATPVVRPLKAIEARMRDAAANSPQRKKVQFFVSDFKASTTSFAGLALDSTLDRKLVRLESQPQANAYADTAYFLSPIRQAGVQAELVYVVKNAGDEALKAARVTLKVNGQQRAVASLSIPPQGQASDTVTFTLPAAGLAEATLAVEDAPITYDDVYYLGFRVTEKLPVVAIGSSNPYLSSLYGGDPSFAFTQMSSGQVDYRVLSQAKTVVLAGLSELSSGLVQEVNKAVSQGATLIVFPPESLTNPTQYAASIRSLGAAGFGPAVESTTGMNLPDLQDEIMQGVLARAESRMELPNVKKYYTLQGGGGAVAKLRNGEAMLVRQANAGSSKGKVYTWAVPLSETWSNLPVQAIFVPMMYRMAMLSGNAGAVAYTLGKNDLIAVDARLSSRSSNYRLRSGKTELVPEVRESGGGSSLNLPADLAQAGVYTLFNPAETDSPLARIGLNYNRNESASAPLSDEALASEADRIGASLTEGSGGSSTGQLAALASTQGGLWRALLIAALVFLAVETLLLRLR